MNPEVSVVVTCYNYGRFVAACLDSVQKQTFSNFETIIIDDGSTDDSEEQIRPFLADKRFRYIKQKNGGQAKAKNKGVSLANGEYIAFLDADDLWEPEKLARQIPLFCSDTIGVVYSIARYIDSNGQDIDFKLTGKYLQPRRGKISDYLALDNFIPFSSSVVDRKCFDVFKTFDESLKMGIDWDLWLRISTKFEFDFVDHPLLIYRIGHSGQMSKNIEERHRCSDRIMINFFKRFPMHTSRKKIKQSWAYTYMNRGNYYKQINPRIAFEYYLRSLNSWPFSLKPIVGMMNLIRKKFFV